MHTGAFGGSPAAGRGKVTAYVALGANLGDASAALAQALQALDRLPHSRVLQASSLYRTAPLATQADGADEADDGVNAAGAVQAPGDDYLNAVVAIETGLPAPALLDALQQLEHQAGRERPYRNAPRTLDLDLLLYGSARIDSARLTLPHPRMMQRAFVLAPLAEIAPALVSAAQLGAVRCQRIERLGHLGA